MVDLYSLNLYLNRRAIATGSAEESLLPPLKITRRPCGLGEGRSSWQWLPKSGDDGDHSSTSAVDSYLEPFIHSCKAFGLSSALLHCLSSPVSPAFYSLTLLLLPLSSCFPIHSFIFSPFQRLIFHSSRSLHSSFRPTLSPLPELRNYR